MAAKANRPGGTGPCLAGAAGVLLHNAPAPAIA